MLFRGMLVGAASGAMGAMVASHNKGGQYLRARVTPSGKVPTAEQMEVRNALASLSAAWGELTTQERDAWTLYANNVPGTNALGDAITLSGQNWYIACNTPRLQAGLARIDAAPYVFNRGTPTVENPTVTVLNASAGVVTFGSAITGPMNALLYQGRPFGAGRSKYYGGYRLADVQDLTAGATAIAFTPTFPLSGSLNSSAIKIVFTQDDGRLSTPVEVTFRG